MHLKTDFGLKEIVDAAGKPRQALLVAPPVDDEAPLDRKLSQGNEELKEEFDGQVEEDIHDLFDDAGITPVKGNNNSVNTIPQPEPQKPTGSEPTGKDKLYMNVREHRPALKTDKNVQDWLTASMKIDVERLTSEPEKVWEEVKQINGWK